MAKRIFATKKRKQDPSLNKIILVLVVLLGAAYGISRVPSWVYSDWFGGEVEASAAQDDLDQARSLVEAGKYDQAYEALKPIVKRVDDPTVTPQALMLQARVLQHRGDDGEALALLERAANAYPGSPEHPVAAARYARLLEDRGQTDKAVRIYAQLNKTAPPEMRAPALMGLARDAERQGDKVRARDLFKDAVKSAAWDSDDWNAALDELGRLNTELIFSTKPTPESKVYTVEAGDNLTSIGMKLNTTQGLLTRANNIDDPRQIRPGQQFKYTPKDFRIIIERSTCRLFLIDKDGLFKRYMTGLGKPGHETTLGSYTIGNKEKDPTWFKPGAEPIPAGDPRNELGTRWMPLVPTEEGLPNDLGIHGTIAPETVGKYMGNGCARMYPDSVEELYDLVVRSTPVEIVDKVAPESIG